MTLTCANYCSHMSFPYAQFLEYCKRAGLGGISNQGSLIKGPKGDPGPQGPPGTNEQVVVITMGGPSIYDLPDGTRWQVRGYVSWGYSPPFSPDDRDLTTGRIRIRHHGWYSIGVSMRIQRGGGTTSTKAGALGIGVYSTLDVVAEAPTSHIGLSCVQITANNQETGQLHFLWRFTEDTIIGVTSTLDPAADGNWTINTTAGNQENRFYVHSIKLDEAPGVMTLAK